MSFCEGFPVAGCHRRNPRPVTATLSFEREGKLKNFCAKCAGEFLWHLITTNVRVCLYRSDDRIMIFDRPQQQQRETGHTEERNMLR